MKTQLVISQHLDSTNEMTSKNHVKDLLISLILNEIHHRTFEFSRFSVLVTFDVDARQIDLNITKN